MSRPQRRGRGNPGRDQTVRRAEDVFGFGPWARWPQRRRMESHPSAAPGPGCTRRELLAALGAGMLAPRLGRAGSAPATTAFPMNELPDLANLHPLLTGLMRAHPPRLSYLDPRWERLADWQAAARPALLARLGAPPAPARVEAELLRREPRDGFTLEVLRLHAPPAPPIPAWVLVPDGPPRRRPAVHALHCHSGRYTWGHEKLVSHPGEPDHLTRFREGTYGRPWAEALARRGYVVLVIDALYFGERRLRAEELPADRVQSEVREAHGAARAANPGSPAWTTAVDRMASFYEHLTAKAITATGFNWPGLLAWDDLRAVDHLVSRPDVDPARIGCLGLSGGGFRTALAIGCDPRIRAACVTGWMTEFSRQLPRHLRHTWMIYVPGLYRELDLPDVAALHAPGALLVQQCRRDHLFPAAGMEAAVAKLAAAYAKAGVPERFRGSFHDLPHSFPPALQEEAFAWLDRWL